MQVLFCFQTQAKAFLPSPHEQQPFKLAYCKGSLHRCLHLEAQYFNHSNDIYNHSNAM